MPTFCLMHATEPNNYSSSGRFLRGKWTHIQITICRFQKNGSSKLPLTLVQGLMQVDQREAIEALWQENTYWFCCYFLSPLLFNKWFDEVQPICIHHTSWNNGPMMHWSFFCRRDKVILEGIRRDPFHIPLQFESLGFENPLGVGSMRCRNSAPKNGHSKFGTNNSSGELGRCQASKFSMLYSVVQMDMSSLELISPRFAIFNGFFPWFSPLPVGIWLECCFQTHGSPRGLQASWIVSWRRTTTRMFERPWGRCWQSGNLNWRPTAGTSPWGWD